MMTKSLTGSGRESVGSRNGTRGISVGRIGMRTLIAALLGVSTLVAFAGADAYAAVGIPSLGAASQYAIVGALSGENTGVSNITGDLGIESNTTTSAGTSTSAGSSGLLGNGLVSGVGALAGPLLGSVAGATVTNTTAAAAAEYAVTHAYQVVTGEVPTRLLSGDALHDATLTPGVYAVAGSLELAGRLLLDARGEKDADFIFEVPSDLTTAPSLQVLLGAGAQASNVIWRVGGLVDIAPATSLVGTVLSEGSITLGAGSKLVGRALSIAGAVNLNDDTVALPLVGATVANTDRAVSAAVGLSVPTIAHATSGIRAVAPTLALGAQAALRLPSVPGRDLATPSLATVPGVGSLVPGGGAAAISLGLPFIPLGAIGVPALAVPVIGLPTLPLSGLSLRASNAPATASPVPPSSASPAVGLPFIPLGGVGVPTLAVPTLGLPTVPISGLSLPALTVPIATSSPASPSIAAPGALAPLSLGGVSLPALTLPSSALSSVTLPGASAPSNSSSAPASNTLPLPLSGISLPKLSLPTTLAPSSTATPQLTLPSVTLPSITSGEVALPRLNVGSPTSGGKSNLAHPRVKENAPARSPRSPRAKSTNSSSSASGSPIPVGAPQTGFGGMAGSDLQLFLEIGALVLALCAGTFAVRSRRIQHG